MIRAIRDWLSSLDDDELRRSRFAKPAGPLADEDRDARRVNETPAQRLARISKLPR